MPPRRVTYRLDSTWRVAAPLPDVWQLLADPAFTWSTWWPLLATERVEVRTGPDGAATPGARAALYVRSPFGRALRLGIEVTAVQHPRDDGATAGERCPARPGREQHSREQPGREQHSHEQPGHARLAVSGDLRGTALVVVRAVGRGTVVGLRWDVTPAASRPDLGASPRLSASAHALVMRAGELGLRHRLRRDLPRDASDGVSPPSSCPWCSSSSSSPPSGAAPP